MDAVEAVRARHEVGGALGGAADAGELHDALGLDAHLVEGVDDALGDGVVAAAGAEGGLAAAIVEDLEADAVGFWRGLRGVAVVVAIRFLPA